MPKEEAKGDFSYLKGYVTSLFPAEDIDFKVPVYEQEQEANLLKETIGGERFFFVVDLLSFEIKEKAGIQRWLNYSENSFTLSQYWSIVHPGKRESLMLIALELYKALCTGQYPLSFMVQRYSSLIALKHYNGHYLLAKKTSSVFQYDRHNRLTSYLNEFTIIAPYNGEPLLPKFFNKWGETELKGNSEVMKAVIGKFIEMKKFSVKELQTARKLAYMPGITQAEIAGEFNVTPSTIDTYCKRFLIKARDFFHYHFTSAIEAALYLKNEGLL